MLELLCDPLCQRLRLKLLDVGFRFAFVNSDVVLLTEAVRTVCEKTLSLMLRANIMFRYRPLAKDRRWYSNCPVPCSILHVEILHECRDRQRNAAKPKL